MGALTQQWPFEWLRVDGVRSVSHLSLLLKVRWEECSPDKWPRSGASPSASPMSVPAAPARTRTLEHPLKYLLFIATLLLRASQNLKSKRTTEQMSCLVVKVSLFYHSLDFPQSVLHFRNLHYTILHTWIYIHAVGYWKWMMLPLTNFFLSDIFPRLKSWTPHWRSWRSSILPVRQTGGGGCGTWPRSGGEWWSTRWLPGPWPPEMREGEPILDLGWLMWGHVTLARIDTDPNTDCHNHRN